MGSLEQLLGMENRRPSQISRLLHRLRDFVSIDTGSGVLRRNLDSPNQCEVQLELDFGRSRGSKGLTMNWSGKSRGLE
jgi:hypothetical protein